MTTESTAGRELAGGAAAGATDERLIAMLVDRARGDEVKMTGAGGLRQELTKWVPESARPPLSSSRSATVRKGRSNLPRVSDQPAVLGDSPCSYCSQRWAISASVVAFQFSAGISAAVWMARAAMRSVFSGSVVARIPEGTVDRDDETVDTGLGELVPADRADLLAEPTRPRRNHQVRLQRRHLFPRYLEDLVQYQPATWHRRHLRRLVGHPVD
jgi:hypothetical protein